MQLMNGSERRLIWLLLAGFVLVAGVIAALYFLPGALVNGKLSDPERLKAENDVRATIVQALVGAGLLAGLFFTAQTYRLNREGQVTERFTRAIDQVGSDKLDIRLGGIYALERIAGESWRDHGPIMEVLTAFVREHAPLPEPRDARHVTTRPAADVRAVMTVLARRNRAHEASGSVLDLSETNLEQINLDGASLEAVNLRMSRLFEASLRGANLSNADLSGAFLDSARLEHANLNHAKLFNTNLSGANLTFAALNQVNLSGANLSGATLIGVGVSFASLNDAVLAGSNLATASFTNSLLKNTDFSSANLEDVSFEESHLTGIRLAGATRWTREQFASLTDDEINEAMRED
jgi:uncharacterized protein YjbI with pentapeptide repeats